MGVIWNIFIDGYWVKRAGVGSDEKRKIMRWGMLVYVQE
jgi:hypothetical protein